jgi:hypothetical protein
MNVGLHPMQAANTCAPAAEEEPYKNTKELVQMVKANCKAKVLEQHQALWHRLVPSSAPALHRRVLEATLSLHSSSNSTTHRRCGRAPQQQEAARGHRV